VAFLFGQQLWALPLTPLASDGNTHVWVIHALGTAKDSSLPRRSGMARILASGNQLKHINKAIKGENNDDHETSQAQT
jgi:hypothetical protein